MDAVEKRAAGEVLSARDEQRLRNHQLRMMRRQYLKDMVSFSYVSFLQCYCLVTVTDGSTSI